MERKRWERFDSSKIKNFFNIPENGWSAEVRERWSYFGDEALIIVNIRDLLQTEWGKIRHLILHKVSFNEVKRRGLIAFLDAEKFSYSERVWILKEFGKSKNLALEVYPRQERLVDEVNVYHLWEIENADVLPFSVQECLSAPNFTDTVVIEDGTVVEYGVKTGIIKNQTFKYLFLRNANGTELGWKQKQQAKEEIYSWVVTAVEVIQEAAISLEYSCLICLPSLYELDFGIHKDDSNT